MVNSGKICDRSQSKAILMTSVKSPRVKMMSGAESSFKIGFKIALKIARIKPASRSNFQSWS